MLFTWYWLETEINKPWWHRLAWALFNVLPVWWGYPRWHVIWVHVCSLALLLTGRFLGHRNASACGWALKIHGWLSVALCYLASDRAFFSPVQFFMRENDLKCCACTRDAQPVWAQPSLCAFVLACVRVCLRVDSGALMLKDVSSFLLLWQPCWAALMLRVCHSRTLSSKTTARGDQNGMFILSMALLSLRRSRFLPVTQSFRSWCYLHWKLQHWLHCKEMSPDRKRKCSCTLEVFSTAFVLEGVTPLSEHTRHVVSSLLSPCVALLN